MESQSALSDFEDEQMFVCDTNEMQITELSDILPKVLLGRCHLNGPLISRQSCATV